MPLTIAGREAALAAGRVLRSADIGVVVTSPFLRCVETAVYVSEGLGYRQGVHCGCFQTSRCVLWCVMSVALVFSLCLFSVFFDQFPIEKLSMHLWF